MKRAALLALSLSALVGCGADIVSGVADAAADDTPDADLAFFDARVASPDVRDAAVREASSVYPAFRPTQPTVVSSGGPVLRAPRLVPVWVSGADGAPSPDEGMLMEFLRQYMASETWLSQVSEYGVGAGTVLDAVHSNGAGLPAGTFSAALLRTWIQTQFERGAWGEYADDTLFVVMLDHARQVQSGNDATCQGIGGFHSDLRDVERHPLAYALIPDCGQGLDTLTRVISHELVEAVTDPYPNIAPAYYQPSTTSPPEGQWAIAYTGGEVADMCEHRNDASLRPADVEFEVARSWSNRAAAAMRDPCVPTAASSVYFNAAPTLPEVVMVATPVSLRAVSAQGLVIPVGESRTLDVQLFSTAPTRGEWRVAAREMTFRGESPAFNFRWDRASGFNGDVLHLTITARDDAPLGRTFKITSSLGYSSTEWVGALTTP